MAYNLIDLQNNFKTENIPDHKPPTTLAYTYQTLYQIVDKRIVSSPIVNHQEIHAMILISEIQCLDYYNMKI